MGPSKKPTRRLLEQGVQEILPAVYDELHELARKAFHAAPGAVTLQPTVLIHEVYLRMARQEGSWRSRTHFFSIAARAMRQVLQNHLRDRHAQKRGGAAWQRVTLSSHEPIDESRTVDLVDLQGALAKLEALDPALAELVELRFFAGLTVAEVAEHLGVSATKVERSWRLARALLRVELDSSATGSGNRE